MTGSEEFPVFGEPLSGANELSLPMARRIVAAVERNPDFRLVGLNRLGDPGKACWETIKVVVQTDGVPTRNQLGINYREPLALVVYSGSELPSVQTLRRSFPQLMHQNETLPSSARELCLYFEPTKAVMRGWTPELFLRRIQWWLANSAKGSLHPADQPVEQLFFVSKYELVLPWNFEALKKVDGLRFAVIPGDKRADGGTTFKLNAGNDPGGKPVSFVQLDLPTVVHGQVLGSPANLGHLHQQLEERGVDFLAELKTKTQDFVGGTGRVAADDEDLLLILVNAPVKRTEDGPVERTHRRAYVLLGSLLTLGEKIGALMRVDGKYFVDTPLGDFKSDGDWQSEILLPAEVLFTNSKEAARKQAGLSDVGPKAALIGVGALGGMLMMLWGRMGWGDWTVIDKDRVKPHNLSRHLAMEFHIGQPKVHVARHLHSAALDNASTLDVVEADATELQHEHVRSALQKAEFVVDASTTLEYPRAVSMHDDFPRHASVFLTPSGRDSVLLVEDRDRKVRLRSLEAQYYRALIQHNFGQDHLDGNGGTFWSGASCRDISVVMPYSIVVAHAGNLADQVRCAQLKDGASIFIWKRDATTGATSFHAVPVDDEVVIQQDDFMLVFDKGVARRLVEMRAAKLPNETGGVLLGYYDFNVGMVVIVDALPAPPDSKGTPQGFDRGKEGLAEIVEEASRRTAGIVRYVGEWHSHPPGHSTRPSPDDRKQLDKLAQEMANDGLPVLQLIVGDSDIRIHRGGDH